MSLFSSIARDQLEQLREEGHVWDEVTRALDLIFQTPQKAQSESGTISTSSGLVFMLPVIGAEPLKVFWSSDGPRVEAVFPYSR